MDHFKNRQSPYFFNQEDLGVDVLADALEAARWAPSPFNSQPWKFIVLSRRCTEFNDVLATLAPRNQMWARVSSFFVVVCAHVPRRAGVHHSSASNYSKFDDMIEFSCGLSVGLFLAELSKSSLQAHQMRGFAIDDVRDTLIKDRDLTPLVVMAVGKETSFDPKIHGHFDETLLLRSEVVRVRKPLDEIIEFRQ